LFEGTIREAVKVWRRVAQSALEGGAGVMVGCGGGRGKTLGG
jgi:hypothetical protein